MILPTISPNAGVVTEPVTVFSSLAMDLELNLLGLSILPSSIPSGFPHYRSLEVVIMETLVIMRVVALALQIVIDTPGCQLDLSGRGGKLGLHLEIMLLCWSQQSFFLSFPSLRVFL